MYSNYIGQQLNVSNKEYPDYQVDSRLMEGPIRRRKPTDVICLIILLLVILSYITISIIHVSTGNLRVIMTPYDSDGRGCGLDEKTRDFKYVYYQYKQGVFRESPRVCVKQCPINQQQQSIECVPTQEIRECELLKKTMYSTEQYMDRVCLPIDQYEQYKKSIHGGFQEILNQIMKNILPIIIVLVSVFTLSLLTIVLIRQCPSVMLWGVILLSIIVLILGGIYYIYLSQQVDIYTAKQRHNFMNIFYSLLGVFTLCLILLACFYSRIKFLISVMAAASQFLQDNISVLLIPITIGILQILFLGFWLYTLINLVSNGKSIYKGTSHVFGELELTRDQQGILGYEIFIFYWIAIFCIHITQFMISSATCIWYFSRNLNESPVSNGIKQTMKFHIGSIALGSLIMTFFKIINNVFRDINREQSNRVLQYIINCFMDCLEAFAKFIGTHAYIQIALTGKSFFPAAWDGFRLIARNALRFGISSGMFNLFTGVGTLFITILTVIIGSLLITKTSFQNHVDDPISLIVLFSVVALAVSDLFMSVWGLIAETIVHCYCVDEELNQETGAVFSTDALKRVMNDYQSK